MADIGGAVNSAAFPVGKVMCRAKAGLRRGTQILRLRYSMISSARASSAAGSVRPSDRAVLELITSSSFVGCSTGRSAGLAPVRILSTQAAAQDQASSGLTTGALRLPRAPDGQVTEAHAWLRALPAVRHGSRISNGSRPAGPPGAPLLIAANPSSRSPTLRVATNCSCTPNDPARTLDFGNPDCMVRIGRV